MARGINKVIIVGNLGTDPETRTFPDGGSLTNISVATSEQWTDKQTGQKMERTEWHRIQFGNRLAEVAAQYLRKGSKVYVEGSLRTRKYQDSKTGADRYATDIRGSVMQMLDSLQPGQAPQQPAPAPQNAPQQAPARSYQDAQQGSAQANAKSMPHPQDHQQAPQAAPVANTFDDFDDDIPF